MKITLPENLATPFAMLMKGIPEELQSDKKFKDAVVVYLKLGGVRMARKFVQTKIRFLDYDPLEIDTGFRFPRLVEAEAEEDSDTEENSEDGEGNAESNNSDKSDESDKSDKSNESDDIKEKDVKDGTPEKEA